MCILRNTCLKRFDIKNVYDTKIKRVKVYIPLNSWVQFQFNIRKKRKSEVSHLSAPRKKTS